MAGHGLALANGGSAIVYTYETQGERTGIAGLLADLGQHGVHFRDLQTRESSLEESSSAW